MPSNKEQRLASSNNNLGYRLKKVSGKSVAKLAEDLSKISVRITEATILFEINSSPQITASGIARKLGLKRSNLTPLITRLQELGYLSLVALDGRSQGLTLSDKGKELFIQVKAIMEQHEKEFFSVLSEEEKQLMGVLLNKLQYQ